METNPEKEEVFSTQKEYRKKLKEFRSKMTQMLATTRFNATTLAENVAFRKRNPKVGCVYCCPMAITRKIPEDTVVFVLEMNNSTNRIEGIGMVKNRSICNKYKIYENMNYNRHVYMGRHRIARGEVSEEEGKIMEVLDTLCFKGAKNMKRGQGITAFPVETLYHCSKHLDLVEYVRQMFKRRIPSKDGGQNISEGKTIKNVD